MHDIYEFYCPFAHIPGFYEWARIHSPAYGSFDCFIIIHNKDTAKPVTVYVNSDIGARYMRNRYPQSLCYRVSPESLKLHSEAEGRTVVGHLEAAEGPIQRVTMKFIAGGDVPPKESMYGGDQFFVWEVNIPAAERILNCRRK